jgi:hypothetical protein
MKSRPSAQRIVQTALSSMFALSTAFVMPAGALAMVSDTDIANTGDGASFTTNSTSTTTANINNVNTAVINQQVYSTADTGHNSASGNIGDVSISTGNAWSTANMQVLANQNSTGLTGLSGGHTGTNLVDIVNTGDHVDVNSALHTTTAVNVNNNNTAYVNQKTASHLNTGHNKAEENIAWGGGVSIHTGDATAHSTMGVNLNRNTTAVNLGTLSPVLGSSTMVTNTGDHADIDVMTHGTTAVNVNNANTAHVTQAAMFYANTGYNKSLENIGDVIIGTGNAASVATMMALANSNMTGIGGSSAGLSYNLADIVNTGDDVDVSSNMASATAVNIHNVNTLHETSLFKSKMSTGHNKAEENISNDPIMTGGAGGAAAMSTNANQSTSIFGSVADMMLLWLLGSL